MKKKLLNYIKENLFPISISFILVLVLVNTTVSFLQVQKAEEHNTLNIDVAVIKERLNKINTHINVADMAVRGFIVIEDDALLNPFNDVIKNYQENYDFLNTSLGNLGYDLSELPAVRKEVSSYMELINSMIVMRRQNQIEKIIDIMKSDPGFEVWKKYSVFVSDATIFVDNLAAESLNEYEKISFIASVVQILLCVVGFPTLLYTIIAINKNNIFKKKLFASIHHSNKKFIFDSNEEEGIQDEKTIIENLITNLRKISAFVKGITGGDYSIKWEGLNENNKDVNKDNIVGDLINMREQMKKVRELDERRLWATEGISIFSEVIRAHQNDVNELCYEVVSNLVKYVKANQGGIFILNGKVDDDKHLELAGCYAFSRKKYLQKRIEIDQGLLGQAFMEEDTIHLNDIPDDYVSIKSGLGDANPSSLLIIPIKYNEKVEAVIELASFNKFLEHEIELVQKIGEYVASAIASVKISAQTRALLESSQEQAELMMTQEEEMRQNMEELQATQEEVQRRTVEYQKIIEENNQELEILRGKVNHLHKKEA